MNGWFAQSGTEELPPHEQDKSPSEIERTIETLLRRGKQAAVRRSVIFHKSTNQRQYGKIHSADRFGRKEWLILYHHILKIQIAQSRQSGEKCVGLHFHFPAVAGGLIPEYAECLHLSSWLLIILF